MTMYTSQDQVLHDKLLILWESKALTKFIILEVIIPKVLFTDTLFKNIDR